MTHRLEPRPVFCVVERLHRDRSLADAVAAAVRLVDPSLVLFGLSGSALIDAGRAAGLATASEVFADRAYLPTSVASPIREHVRAAAREAPLREGYRRTERSQPARPAQLSLAV